MAHPKRRQSSTRRDKRRTHYKIEAPQLAIDSTTGEAHLYHRAHWSDGKLYYKGKVVLEKVQEVTE
ncbi:MULTISPECIES: 50S ribosomal protein L32 [Faecalibacter]|jgi:large subunit ribosomal protein L32|uniref:Large ribosomal subunit protein bL32 n=2 Tax=Faecalibacter TaxID=2766734 RepID=A0A3L9MNY5_9FLAO|nr:MULTISPECIES: 50S ribosomal protein L32 [Faecalibacter]MBS7334032.1 50S ribosomal protein L32 [Weeksellaceae bacterium]QTV06087.1 50S ribosomal protein L32 [Faecalibacter bovis]RLZ12359.1 50S ribosomal protein L32 [Faecalibacter macacae]